MHRAPWLVIYELGWRRNALSADPFSQRDKPFSYSISRHTYCFYFGCECLCVLRMSFACSRCIADPETCPLLAAARSNSQQRRAATSLATSLATSRPIRAHWAHREGGSAGAPTSRLRQRVNTHTIQRCCMRNQCEFGKLHNLNIF